MPRWPIPLLAAASPLVLVALLVGGSAGEALFVSASLLFPPALIALGARGRRAGAVGRLALALGLLLEASAALLLARHTTLAAAPGLGLGLMILGLCGLPLVLVAVGHAALFDEDEERR
jgi:hypothetical protein